MSDGNYTELLLEILERLITFSFPHGWARQNHSAINDLYSCLLNTGTIKCDIWKQFNKQSTQDSINRAIFVTNSAAMTIVIRATLKFSKLKNLYRTF